MKFENFYGSSELGVPAKELETLLVVSNSSVHNDNFMNGVSPHFKTIHLITDENPKNPPQNIGDILFVDFSGSAVAVTPSRIRDFYKKTKASVVCIQQASTTAFHSFLGLWGLNVPSLLIIWGSDVLLNPKRSFLLKQMVKFNLRQAWQIVCETSTIADTVRKLAGKPLKVELLNFGVDSIPSEIITKKRCEILSCRFHTPLYRIDSILKAFAKIIYDHNLRGWTLTLAAQGIETDKLKVLAKRLKIDPYVKFVGFLSKQELIERYKQSAIFVSVPESDGLSVSLLEAMAFGCIPVLSDLPSNREVVINGLNGYIVADLELLDRVIIQAIAISENSELMKCRTMINFDLIRSRADYKPNMQRYSQILRRLARAQVKRDSNQNVLMD